MMIGNVIEKVHITVGHSEIGRVTFDLDVRMQGTNSRDDGFIAEIFNPAKVWGAISNIQIPPPNRIAEVRLLSKSPESTDSARAVHSLDSPATLPVESGLPVRF